MYSLIYFIIHPATNNLTNNVSSLNRIKSIVRKLNAKSTKTIILLYDDTNSQLKNCCRFLSYFRAQVRSLISTYAIEDFLLNFFVWRDWNHRVGGFLWSLLGRIFHQRGFRWSITFTGYLLRVKSLKQSGFHVRTMIPIKVIF